MLASFGVTASAKTEIKNVSPAITADVGEKIDLTAYSVVFDESIKAVSNVVWKDESGATVTEVTPDKKGVIKLTAINAEKNWEKTIYVVAKEKDETEYVLYEADFSKYTSVDELRKDGFVTNDGDNCYTFEDGALLIGNGSRDYVRLIFPEWLGDFGDYSITADAKMINSADTNRWFGLVYRIKNENGKYYPYYHMCVRENTTLSNGIEFAERTSKDAWNVAVTAMGDIYSLKDGYHKFNIQAFGNKIQYNIDGLEYIYTTDSIIGSKVPYYAKGMVGLTVNYGRMSVKTVKIAIQEKVPVKAEKRVKLIENKHDANNLINTIANVERVGFADDIGSAGIVMAKVSEIDDVSAFVSKCHENQVLPTFIVESEDDVNKVDEAYKANVKIDANVVSTDAKLLKAMRDKQPIFRTGLIVDIDSANITETTANEIRLAVRSAPATFCVIPIEDATYDMVDELQELAIAVWVDMSSVSAEEYTVKALQALTAGANGVISTSESELTKVINEYFVENTMTRTPVMIGHRGNPSQAPENSLSGFIKAYENGADVFEVDVEITRDGEIIIMHDSTLNRTTNYTGSLNVNQMTLNDIKKYYVKTKSGTLTDETVPTLREVFEEFKDKDCKIFVEFKGGNANNIKTTCALIKEYGMEHKVDVISFNIAFLTATQKEIPGMATGYLHSPSGAAGTPIDALDVIYTSLQMAQKYNSTINPSNTVATRDYMQAATDRGITVWPWTYNAGNNESAFLSGCDGVTTDDMQWVTNMAKNIVAGDIGVAKGQTANSGAKVVTYGNTETEIDGSNLIVKVIDGNDFISVENGVITGVEEGTATVMYGYATKTTAGGEYVVYSQPVKVNVSIPEVNEEQKSEGGNGIVIVIVSVVAVLALGIGGFVFFKKKKA